MKLRPLPNTVAITSPEQLKHGMMVTCDIRYSSGDKWKTVKDAKISVCEGEVKYICQNVCEELETDDKLGYKFSFCVSIFSGKWASDFKDCVRNLRAIESQPQAPKATKPDTWTLDAPIYRRGSDWIREDKMSIAGKEYTFDEVCEQEAKFRSARRAFIRYFPKGK